jgi:DNA-binding NarL/FixJ family response regulator
LLSEVQLRAALDGLRELGELRDLAEFPAAVARLLRRLVPSEGSSYNALDQLTGQATFFTDPDDRVFAGGPEIFARFSWQHPLLRHYARTGDRRALRISEFSTKRELHRTDLYNHIYRHIGLEHQLAINLPPRQSRPRELIGLALDRGQRDFSAADAALLELLRPHLANILDRLDELATLRAAVEHGSPELMVLVADDATVAWATPAAAERLRLVPGGALPRPLRAFVKAQLAGGRQVARPGTSGAPETVDLGDYRVTATLVARAHPHLHVLRLTLLGGLPRTADLRSLGLTSRQADVLALLVRGLTARQIGDELYLSPRTVEKHLAATYARLGVTTRAEAIVRALHGTAR